MKASCLTASLESTGHLVVGLILITCLGIFHGPVVGLGDAIALEDLDHSSRHVYGRIRLWSSAGYALSIVIFGIVYQSIDVVLALPFYAIAILGLAFSARGFRAGTIGVKETRELRFISLITPRFAGFLLIVLLVDSAQAIWVLVLLRTLSGVGFGIFYVASVLLTDTLAPAGLRATAQQTMQAVGWGISPLIGGVVGGALYAHLGAPSMFFVAALTVGSGIVLAWATLGRTTSLQTRSG